MEKNEFHYLEKLIWKAHPEFFGLSIPWCRDQMNDVPLEVTYMSGGLSKRILTEVLKLVVLGKYDFEYRCKLNLIAQFGSFGLSTFWSSNQMNDVCLQTDFLIAKRSTDTFTEEFKPVLWRNLSLKTVKSRISFHFSEIVNCKIPVAKLQEPLFRIHQPLNVRVFGLTFWWKECSQKLRRKLNLNDWLS